MKIIAFAVMVLVSEQSAAGNEHEEQITLVCSRSEILKKGDETFPFFLERFPEFKQAWMIVGVLLTVDRIAVRVSEQNRHPTGLYPFFSNEIDTIEFSKLGLKISPHAFVRFWFDDDGVKVTFKNLPRAALLKLHEALDSQSIPQPKKADLMSLVRRAHLPNRELSFRLGPDDREGFFHALRTVWD